MTKIESYISDLNAALDARAAYESAKASDNSSMQKTLTDIRKSITHSAVATIMSASNVDANFINRAERSNNRYNVYAAEKVANVARMLASVATLNHYTQAIFKSLVAFESAEYALTHKDAVCACSKSVKQTDSKRESVLKSTRYDKHVSANTASTQASSSLNALLTFNVITETRDASSVTYKLNRDNAACKAIAEKLQIAI